MANISTIQIQLVGNDAGFTRTIDSAGNRLDLFNSKNVSITQSIQTAWLQTSVVLAGWAIAAKKAWDLAEAAAGYQEQIASLGALGAAYGVTGEQIVSRLKDITVGLLSSASAANIAANALTQGLSPDQLYEVARAAETLSNVTGQKLSVQMESLTRGLVLGKEKTLEMVIGTIDLKARYGELAEKMSDTEKIAARYRIVMERVAAIQKDVGDSASSTADGMERLRAQAEDIAKSIGAALIRFGAIVMAVFQGVAGFLSFIVGMQFKVIQGFAWVTDQLGITSDAFETVGRVAGSLIQSSDDLKTKMVANWNFAVGGADAYTQSVNRSGDALKKLRDEEAAREKKLKTERDAAEAAKKGEDSRNAVRASKAGLDAFKWETEAKQQMAGFLTIDEIKKRTAAAIKESDALEERLLQGQVDLDKKIEDETRRFEAAKAATALAYATQLSNQEQDLVDRKVARGEMTQLTAIQRRAEIESTLLEFKRQQALADASAAQNDADLLTYLEEAARLQRDITALKEREAYDLDQRRLELSRSILDIERQQADLKAQQSARKFGDATSFIGNSGIAGGGDVASGATAINSIDTGQDPAFQEYSRWNELQAQKIRDMVENHATQKELNDQLSQSGIKFAEMESDQKVKKTAAGFQMMGGLADMFYAASKGRNKAAFKAAQALHSAEIVVNTAKSASDAYQSAGNPYLGAALAAIAIAFGAAQLSAVWGANPDSGNRSVASAGGGFSAPASSGPGPAPAEKDPVAPIVNVHVYGSVVTQDDFARQIIPTIAKAWADGVR